MFSWPFKLEFHLICLCSVVTKQMRSFSTKSLWKLSLYRFPRWPQVSAPVHEEQCGWSARVSTMSHDVNSKRRFLFRCGNISIPHPTLQHRARSTGSSMQPAGRSSSRNLCRRSTGAMSFLISAFAEDIWVRTVLQPSVLMVTRPFRNLLGTFLDSF